MPNKRFKVLDLFAGAGGFSLGFDLVINSKGDKIYEIVLAVDNDKYASQTLREYFIREYGKENIVFQADLTEKETHEKIVKKCGNNIDIVIGGPPCQSFSLIGPRSGYKSSGRKKYKTMDKLYIEYIKLVDELKPSFIVFENVKGILSKKGKYGRCYLDIIISEFERIGYNFEIDNEEIKTNYLLLNVADYGIPQTRERIFLIGNNLGIRNPYPVPTNSDGNRVNFFEATGDLPKIKAKMTKTDIKKKNYAKICKYNKKVFNGMDEIPYHIESFDKHFKLVSEKGKEFLCFIKSANGKELTHHVARSQKRNDIMLFRRMKQGMTSKDIFSGKTKESKILRKFIKYDMSSFKDKYKKQHWDRPCSTIFAHLSKDGNRFIHPDSIQARTITPREAARIQSFPDDFVFCGPITQKFRQIGNAVPPLMAYNIAKAIYAALKIE